MAADLQPLISLAGSLSDFGLAALLIYLVLLTTVAMTAVFSKDETRRKDALEVLRVLRPGWRRRPPHDDEPRSLPPPNP